MFDPSTEPRLAALLKAAQVACAEVEKGRRDIQLELSKERTQFFEKIALGCGATIAATVSFVGSHSGKLHPPFVLRAALVAFVLALAGSLVRNWRYPYYVLAVWDFSQASTLQARERAKRDYFVACPTSSMQTGEEIDGAEWAKTYAPQDIKLTSWIEDSERLSKKIFRQVKWIEYLALTCSALGVLSLVMLAWMNF